jgi:hypothetical protein
VAIFHLSFKVLTRTTKTGKSKSSLYLAAYNSREKLKDELTGLTFDYTKKTIYIKAALFCQKMPLPDSMTGLHYGEIASRKAPGQSDLSLFYHILATRIKRRTKRGAIKKIFKKEFYKIGNVCRLCYSRYK